MNSTIKRPDHSQDEVGVGESKSSDDSDSVGTVHTNDLPALLEFGMMETGLIQPPNPDPTHEIDFPNRQTLEDFLMKGLEVPRERAKEILIKYEGQRNDLAKIVDSKEVRINEELNVVLDHVDTWSDHLSHFIYMMSGSIVGVGFANGHYSSFVVGLGLWWLADYAGSVSKQKRSIVELPGSSANLQLKSSTASAQNPSTIRPSWEMIINNYLARREISDRDHELQKEIYYELKGMGFPVPYSAGQGATRICKEIVSFHGQESYQDFLRSYFNLAAKMMPNFHFATFDEDIGRLIEETGNKINPNAGIVLEIMKVLDEKIDHCNGETPFYKRYTDLFAETKRYVIATKSKGLPLARDILKQAGFRVKQIENRSNQIREPGYHPQDVTHLVDLALADLGCLV